MNNTIFVSIACWRDPFIWNTVKSIFDNAMFPDRVHVGIIFQGYQPQDDVMLNGVKDIAPENITINYLNAETAPINICEIRGDKIKELVKDEEYFLQIDSHTKMAWAWDVCLIAELKVAASVVANPNLYLQGYTTVFSNWDDPLEQMPLTCVPDEATFREQNSALQGKVTKKSEHTFIRERFYNANFVFAPMRFIYEVPQPSDLSFDWEQPVMAMRVFTAGWDAYSPTTSYAGCFGYNNFEEEELQKHTRHVRKKDPLQKESFYLAEAESRLKFYKIMLNGELYDSFGPLVNRTVEEYKEFLGYNPISLEVFEAVSNSEIFVVPEWRLVEEKVNQVVEMSEV